MADSFKGTGSVTIQPDDVNVPVFLRLSAASASTKNDGSMPNGSTVISAVVTAHFAKTSVDASTNLVASSTESGNSIIAYLSHSTALETGLYHLQALVTMSLSGSTANMTKQYDFHRVYVKDR